MSKVQDLLKRVSSWSDSTVSDIITECAKNELLIPNSKNLDATVLYEKLIDGYLDHPGHTVATLTTILSILIPFYSHNATPNKYYYIGLYLLVLLGNKQSSEYYAMIDTITPKDVIENIYIDYCMQIHFSIEQGSFAQLHALLNGPSPHYQSLLKMILDTLQKRILKMASVTYPHLSVQSAVHMLYCENTEHVITLVKEMGWRIENGWILFNQAEEKLDIDCNLLAKRAVLYQKELDKIV